MSPVKKQFQFSPGITLLALAAASLCYGMSYWQYSRYLWKRDYVAAVAAQEARGRQAFAVAEAADPGYLHALVTAKGSFDYAREVVLLNRSIEEQPGVHIVTPMSLQDGSHVLVLRGFVPYNLWAEKQTEKYRREGEQEVEGVVRPSQTKSFFLSPPAKPGTIEAPKETWFRLDVEAIAKQLPYPVVPVYLEQTNQQGGAPVHDAHELVPPSRHVNYTLQWGSFGTFALVWAFFIQYKKRGVTDLQQQSEPNLP